ncbi:hypothetical protein EJ06DRAFT_557130 [Trichodelitschia bisporula]|uniref:WSC domain-containing protein n=1 Tax=Trichodelitschia bisporula TaxID=703511 RepID=A0A6G1HVV2_9PEZI|nr:hypothetical protein EJ06DRAFT_557130 [Trichodelitschia bisporula]
MFASTLNAALAVAMLFSASQVSAQLIPTATAKVPMNALTAVGCFSTPEPMVDHGPWTFQSSGNCQPICYQLQQPVMGLVNGTNCWCGSLIPPENTKVDNSSCNTPCAGIDTENCGGPDLWWVYLTGITRNRIGYLDPKSLTGTSGSPTTKTSSTTQPPSTVVVTASNTPAHKSKSNTVGIAVGVVVGIIVIAGIVGGVWLFLRQKRRQKAEEEYRRQAAVSSFMAGGKHGGSTSSGGDSRLDPIIMQRRESTGSIADNQDYSRRILKVTNPDGY